MAIKKVEKQSYEAFFIAGSILKIQKETGDTEVLSLVDCSVVAQDKDGLDVSATFLEQGTIALDNDPDGSYVDNMLAMRCRVGDEAVSPYLVTFYMKTNEGNQWEVDMQVVVKEITC